MCDVVSDESTLMGGTLYKFAKEVDGHSFKGSTIYHERVSSYELPLS